MPSKSRSQQKLFQAAAHDAAFSKAKQLRNTMSMNQLHDFASGSMAGKPAHVKQAKSTHPGGNLGTFLHPKRAQQ